MKLTSFPLRFFFRSVIPVQDIHWVYIQPVSGIFLGEQSLLLNGFGFIMSTSKGFSHIKKVQHKISLFCWHAFIFAHSVSKLKRWISNQIIVCRKDCKTNIHIFGYWCNFCTSSQTLQYALCLAQTMLIFTASYICIICVIYFTLSFVANHATCSYWHHIKNTCQNTVETG